MSPSCPRSPRHCRRAAGLALAALTPLLALGAFAAEPGAHVHGAAVLRIVADGAQHEVTLESPLDNLLGFEHAPNTERQRASVREMAAKLRQPQRLFTPTAAARCTPAGVEIAAPTLPAALIGNPQPAAGTRADAASGAEHADLDATFRWRCDAPAQLKGLDVGLMQAFPGLRVLKVQVAGPRGQSAAVLSAGTRSVAW